MLGNRNSPRVPMGPDLDQCGVNKGCVCFSHGFLSLQDVLVKVVRKEGFFSLWKGFTPYYARLGPHTVLTFIFLEQMNKFYKIYFLDS